ncbi:type I-E CRISPR-associated protein Cse1/CasA [Candidatus Synechococcus calcipolaris G9]|uniref:Type I-E CRISPR-associated protein Cse1/CasA n=1 Tax=Candidatus Synechococcus calcipolaris G9 TaxID=1497997 RepID=A0ABT6F166_9SYNE|nr:type I-E CRISPR-associated protein Cse1/CasA [Candidatus Synechococcus calcipolaris]MDG2991567.1 type I-E CRISPR-associated protein Cse1/CasA [Candidatus Synechococcus calcipolaris G9]
MSFNLVNQPWIPVMTPDFHVKEISLVELFQTWESLREIQADNPPTTLAIYRLLLAILHRAYHGPSNEDHWEEIFKDNGQGAIADLNKWRDRFDLLHTDHPFMQDPVLPLEKAVPIYALHTMSTCQVFSHEHEWSGYSISLPQAARLLVRLQGVDITSLRAFYVGQSSGNRSAVNTPTINAANVLVRGSTLKQTLMLNLMRYDPAADMPSAVTGEDLPAWETGYGGKPKKARPQGYISYLTFPWRRLRLFPENGEVSQLAITMGNSLPDQVSPQKWECGVAYRENKPVRLSLSKQIWRNADAFLLTAEKQHRPRIVDWLADLKLEDLVDYVVTFQISGLSADKAKPLGWSWEQFSAPIRYVTDADLSQTLKIAIAMAEEHKRIFGSFQGSPYYALAKELNPPNASNKAISQQADRLAANLNGAIQYWATLDRAFPKLLHALPQDSHTGADGITRYGFKELPAWTQTVQTAARNAFTESIASIRNYQARAAALRTLELKLADLRASPEEKEAKKAKAAAKRKAKLQASAN